MQHYETPRFVEPKEYSNQHFGAFRNAKLEKFVAERLDPITRQKLLEIAIFKLCENPNNLSTVCLF